MTKMRHLYHLVPLLLTSCYNFSHSKTPTPNNKMTQMTMSGCGSNLNLPSSTAYAQINLDMHHDMAINFTGNAEYDFVAGMIPHHTAAVDMCDAYEQHAQDLGIANAGIDSLCYNITYGPEEWGEWQFDFSQPGENEQMFEILMDLDMVDHYFNGCSDLYGSPVMEGRMDGANLDMTMNHTDSHDDHDAMFMGCGELHLDQTKDYIKINMDMHMRMAINWTGHPGIDFLLGMIPHHQAAIAMCDIYYKYWPCAPQREVCIDPLPLNEIQILLSSNEQVSVLNKMHHICTGHIMETQPKEVEWMLAELGRLSPDALEMYQTMLVENTYPCHHVMEHHDMMGNGTMMDGHKYHMKNETNGDTDDHGGMHPGNNDVKGAESGAGILSPNILVCIIIGIINILLVRA